MTHDGNRATSVVRLMRQGESVAEDEYLDVTCEASFGCDSAKSVTSVEVNGERVEHRYERGRIYFSVPTGVRELSVNGIPMKATT